MIIAPPPPRIGHPSNGSLEPPMCFSRCPCCSLFMFSPHIHTVVMVIYVPDSRAEQSRAEWPRLRLILARINRTVHNIHSCTGLCGLLEVVSCKKAEQSYRRRGNNYIFMFETGCISRNANQKNAGFMAVHCSTNMWAAGTNLHFFFFFFKGSAFNM